MRMTPEHFFELFLKELEQREEMHRYYKFLGKASSFHFRKNYFLERLRYIAKQINDPAKTVWDCGSGYGTTGLFLAMNGIKTHGTTLEFYYESVAKRYEYWNQFGDASLFTCSYENLFDAPPPAESYDVIIVQDTLHHLEPINDALQIFHQALKPGGKIVAIEENGNNIIQNAKLYKYRGNKRIIKQWDEKLQKDILIGNENIRSLKSWTDLLTGNKFMLDQDSVQYIRYFLPFRYRNADPEGLLKKEFEIQRKSRLRKEYFFFGMNFVAEKK
ncbi:MAG: class I SAM-dependent methyltransferase [Taibaiella sp.]|jgi:SAM-dependent methyltransferase